MLFAFVTACLKRESPALAAIAVGAVLVPSWRNIRAWSVRMRLGAVVGAVVAVLIVASLLDFSEQAGAASGLGSLPP